MPRSQGQSHYGANALSRVVLMGTAGVWFLAGACRWFHGRDGARRVLQTQRCCIEIACGVLYLRGLAAQVQVRLAAGAGRLAG